MKENTKITLVWLYCERVGQRWVSVNSLKKLLPELTLSGLKSLIFLMEKKELVLVEKIRGEFAVSITSTGKRALESYFPSLLANDLHWDGNWTQVVFLKPPQSDQNFRYLRRKLLDWNYIAITRGVFMYAGAASAQLLDLCKQLYKRSVLILTVNRWEFGEELGIMGLKDELFGIKDSYSSISREIDGLIEEKESQKGLTESYEMSVYSVFNRFYQILKSDSGLVWYYFPQEQKPLKLLFLLQSII